MDQLVILPDIFNESSIGLAIKIFQLILTGLFVIFSFLTIRQVGLMTHTITNALRVEVRLLAYFQFFLGVGVFLALLFL